MRLHTKRKITLKEGQESSLHTHTTRVGILDF